MAVAGYASHRHRWRYTRNNVGIGISNGATAHAVHQNKYWYLFIAARSLFERVQGNNYNTQK